jgi:mRNA interferase YafQ
MYKIIQTSQFKKDLKKLTKQGKSLDKLAKVVDLLAAGASLPEKYRDHLLKGDYNGVRDCHIEPDWLLLYKIFDDVLILELTRTGSHSNLFRR